MTVSNDVYQALRGTFSALSIRIRRLAFGKQMTSKKPEMDFNRLVARIDALAAQIDEKATATSGEILQLRSEASRLSNQIQDIRLIADCLFDGMLGLRKELSETRNSARYIESLASKEPLISVRVATYNRPKLLFERAIPSVLAQTYQNLELIVVGDGASEDTVTRAAEIKDPRFRFINLPRRGIYPDDPQKRWLVAGSPAMNFGARCAKGGWIAPLDDDDEFSRDHLEVLLRHAQSEGTEMVYGRIRVIPSDGAPDYLIGEYPPKHGQFGFQSAMYLAALNFFEYDPQCWIVNEPGDWNLCRRMMAAGVHIGFTSRVVTTIYPNGPSGSST